MKRRRYPPQVAMKKTVEQPNPRMSRVQRFLKQMMKEDVRDKYIDTVDQHVNRLLDSVRVKEVKSSGKRGVNNRPKSQQAQINESKDRVDVTSPYSILTHVSNPRLLLNPQTFASLPMFYQYKLVKALPACDQIVTEQGWIKPSSTSLTNEFFTKASMEWIESLKEGRFTQEYLSKKKQDIERERHKLDPWKVRNFEPIWGQKQISQDDSIDEYHRIPRTVIPYSGPPRNVAPKPDFCDDDEEDIENGVIPVFTGEISSETDVDVSPRKRLRTSTATNHVEDTRRLEETHELVPVSLKESTSTTPSPVSRRGKQPSPTLTRRGTRSSTAASRREKVETTTSRVNSSNDDDELLRRLLPEILPESAVFRTPKGYDTSCSSENVLSSGIIVSTTSSISSEAKESPVSGSPSKTTHLLTISTSGKLLSTHLAHGDDFNSSLNLQLNESTSPNKMSSPSRRHRRQRISAPLMKRADGVDEMRSQSICQKAIEDSNRLFFVTNRGRIQQLNQNIDQTNIPLRESNNVPSSSQTSNNQSLITSTTKIPLTSDVEIIPVASSPSKLPLVQPDGQRREVDLDHSERTNNLVDVKQNILSSILTSKITKNDYQNQKASSEMLPILPYKLPNDITITPTFTATTSSNQVPVITRTEQSSTSCNTETSNVWVTGSAISSVSTTAIVSPANSSDEDCEGVFTRLPAHITVIPLGPTPETSASEEEAEFSMMNGHTKGEEDDHQQSPGNMQFECACDLKAMIPCANCSALCHQDCITPAGFCMPCHYNQDIYSVQPLPSGIINSSSAY